MNLESYELLGEKARDIITDILASWYNFSLAQSLTRWKRICWAITASYYSMMLATRGFVTLLVFESINKMKYNALRKFIQYHDKLIALLCKDDRRYRDVMTWWNTFDFSPFKDMLVSYGYSTNTEEAGENGKEMTANIGKLLNGCKAFRENSSYDTYIIMAQHWRRVTTGDQRFENFRDDISDLSDRILELDQGYLKFISDTLVTFLRSKENHPTLKVVIPIQVKLYLSLLNELYDLLNYEGLLRLYKNKLDPITEKFISEYRQYQSSDGFSTCFSNLRSEHPSPEVQAFLRGFGIPDRKKNSFDKYLTNLENLETAINEFKFIAT